MGSGAFRLSRLQRAYRRLRFIELFGLNQSLNQLLVGLCLAGTQGNRFLKLLYRLLVFAFLQ